MVETAGVGRGALNADPWRLRQKQPGSGCWSPQRALPGRPRVVMVVVEDGATLSGVSCGSCPIIQV